MKSKDIALIAVVIIASSVISLVLSGIFISSPKNRRATVEVVAPINSTFTQPDKQYFNPKAINPTQNIQIGGTSNRQPFNDQN